LKCHFSKFVWIRRLKAKTADKAADKLIKWLNNNGYITILACNNRGEFKGKVIEVCKKRGIKIICRQAYYPQSQGSIKVTNRIFKKRLQAIQADTGIQSWIQLLPLIVWVINTTAIPALPKSNTLCKVWFGRKPPTNFLDYKESTYYIYTALGEGGIDINKSSTSEKSSTIKVQGEEENREDSLFVNKEAEQEEVVEEMILSELTKRVTEYIKKQ
jgi:hypothetical protein